MRRGSLFTLMNDCESKQARQRRRVPRSAPAPTTSASPPPAPLPSHPSSPQMAASQSVQSGFYDYGEPISLSVSHTVSHPSQPGMMPSTADYGALSTSDAYSPQDSHHAFYVEPFETESNGETAAPAEQEPAGGRNGDRPPTFPTDQGTSAKRTPAPSRQSKSQPDEDLQPTTTEVLPSEDEEFEADLREILAGKKRYDAQHRRAVTNDERPSRQGTHSAQQPLPDPPEDPVTKNEHAIFDRIAQSMKLANAYDLGSIALDQRFDAFDQEDDQREKKKPQ